MLRALLARLVARLRTDEETTDECELAEFDEKTRRLEGQYRDDR